MTEKEKQQEMQRKAMEANLLENQIRQIEQQLMLVNQQFLEIQTLQFNLDELKKIKEERDILVPLGRNVFIDAKLKINDKVLVNVGEKVIVKKSIDGAKKILEKQKDKFLKARDEMSGEMSKIIENISKIEG